MNFFRRIPTSALRLALPVAGAVLLLMVSGCSRKPDVVTEAAGHRILVAAQGNVSLTSQDESAVIRGTYGQVIVERERVRLDELAWTAIPADVPVKVTIRRNHVRIQAGRVSIARTVSD